MSPAREGGAEAKRYIALPRPLRMFWAGSLAVFGLGLLVSWLKFRAGAPVGDWDPLNDRLFGDLMEYPGTYKLLHTAAFFFNVAGRPWPYPFYSAVAYPPFAAAVMTPIYAFRVPEVAFLAVSGAWLTALAGWVARALMRAGIRTATAVALPVSLALISFPIERLVHQGNIEVVLWIFTAVGVLAFWRGHDDAAAVLWGLAGAMKLFPIVLLLLLLPLAQVARDGVGCGDVCGGDSVGAVVAGADGAGGVGWLDAKRFRVREHTDGGVDAARAGGEPLAD